MIFFLLIFFAVSSLNAMEEKNNRNAFYDSIALRVKQSRIPHELDQQKDSENNIMIKSMSFTNKRKKNLNSPVKKIKKLAKQKSKYVEESKNSEKNKSFEESYRFIKTSRRFFSIKDLPESIFVGKDFEVESDQSKIAQSDLYS